MDDKNTVTWDDVPYDIKELVEFGVYTIEEAIEYCEHGRTVSYDYNKSIYKEEDFLLAHKGQKSCYYCRFVDHEWTADLCECYCVKHYCHTDEDNVCNEWKWNGCMQ